MKKHSGLLCLILALILILSSAVPAFAAHPFKDVSAGKWYTPYVEYVYENNLMNGTTNTTFAPDAKMSRAMVVTVLHRLEGEPASSAKLPFRDVPSGKYYTEAVRWSYEKGIVSGTSSTAFSPNVDITRQQIVTIFYRYAQSKGLDTSARANLSAYSDCGSISNFASNAFRWAVSVGIITGTSDTRLSPTDNATRAQCAAILQRFIGWLNGDPPMPSGAVLVTAPDDYSKALTPHAALNITPSLSAGLLRLPNGSYQTTDGRLTAKPNTTTYLYTYADYEGKKIASEYSTGSASATVEETSKTSTSTYLECRISAWGKEKFSFSYTTSYKPSKPNKSDLLNYSDWKVIMNSSMFYYSTSKFHSSPNVKVRRMLSSDTAIVYYVYCQNEHYTLPVNPTQPNYAMEALIVISPDAVEYTPLKESGSDQDDNNNNNTNPDNEHDNDYGSALPCTACRGSGDCSKCGGDGKIWSSAADKENRNCTKCNGSGRCQTCGGSGKRYN